MRCVDSRGEQSTQLFQSKLTLDHDAETESLIDRGSQHLGSVTAGTAAAPLRLHTRVDRRKAASWEMRR